jgi:hypothetical protein
MRARAGHVDHRKLRIDFSGTLRDFPAIHGAEQIYIDHNSPVLTPVSLEQSDRLFPRGDNCRFKPAIG